MAETIEIQLEDDFFWHGLVWSNLLCIWNSRCKYEKVLVDDVIDQLDHLYAQQKNDLKQVLSEHATLFGDTLEVYPHREFHINLVPGAVPKHFRPYTIQVIHLEAFKKGLNPACWDRGIISSRCQWVGIPNLYHTQKRRQSSLGLWLKRVK